MNIIDKIVVWFKNFFLSFYKIEVIDSAENFDEQVIEKTTETTNNFIIRMRNCIQSYSFTNMTVSIDGNEVSLPDDLGYHEEYVFESNSSNYWIEFKLSTSIRCVDGYTMNNLSMTKNISKGETIINVSDRMLGLVPIVFSATVEDFQDFEPTITKTISI